MSFDMQTVDAEVRIANQALALARSYVIDSQEMADAAAEDLREIKTRQKTLVEVRMSMTRPLDESKKRIMELFATPAEALEQAENVLKNVLMDWTKKCREVEEAARKEREEAARKIAEEARIAAAEAARKAAEAEAAEKLALSQLEKTGTDNEEAIAVAAIAASTAAEAVAEAAAAAMVAENIEYMAPVVAEAPAKIKGFSTREDWKAEVTDFMALVKAVAAGEASIELLEANTKAINQRAKALKAEFKVPGIRVYSTDVASARSR